MFYIWSRLKDGSVQLVETTTAVLEVAKSRTAEVASARSYRQIVFLTEGTTDTAMEHPIVSFAGGADGTWDPASDLNYGKG